MNPGITFEKQDLPFEPEPNIALPVATVDGTDVIVSFDVKGPDWPQDRAKREVVFKDCVIYRIGDPNDEGFHLPDKNNSSNFSKGNFPELEFNSLYRVKGMDWKNSLLGNGTVVTDGKFESKDGLAHYLFLMKEGSFECVAKGFEVIGLQ